MIKIGNGLLVILEGGEGVGKTTHAKALVDYYNERGYSAKYFREPGGNKLAEEIRNMVLYNEMDSVTETLLMNAARNINIQTNILPALRDGNIVILDRFTKSTLVYQGVLKNGNMDFINNCIDEVTKDLDDGYGIEFTLLCEPEIAMERAAAEGHERNKNDILPIEDYKKINDAYRELYKISYGITCVIDTTHKTQEAVFENLKYAIYKILEGCEMYEDIDGFED
jgi:dTMP kinase